MPRKAKQNSAVPVAASVAAAVAEQAEPKSKGKNKRAKKEAPVEVTPVVETVAETTTVAETSGEKKKRPTPTRDSVLSGFDALVASVDEEITKLRESATKAKGVKFMRSFNKKLKSLRTQSSRVMKQKPPTKRKNNSNSGFLKPVRISKEMAKFTGWDQKELKSRVSVTKMICQYIKEHNLQNPADRRQIQVEKDPKLQKLLGYDPKDDKPVTYYRLQSLMKGHFSKPEEEKATA